MVDIHDVVCRKCDEKQPFACSKCGVRLSSVELFEPEKIAFKKTPFCSRCGKENEHVPCHQCKISMVKSTGRTRTGSSGRELVYHDECWAQYEKQERISTKLLGIGTPIAGLAFTLLGYVFVHTFVSALEIGAVAAGAMAIGGVITRPRG
jgi:hypothetical protein